MLVLYRPRKVQIQAIKLKTNFDPPFLQKKNKEVMRSISQAAISLTDQIPTAEAPFMANGEVKLQCFQSISLRTGRVPALIQ